MVKSGRRLGALASKNSVANVRIVDPYSGSDGAKVDRILSSMQNSHSQITVLCSSRATVAGATGGTVAGVRTFTDCELTDDFQSFSQQFETYRIRAMRIDVYDINPANTATVYVGTFHDVAPTQYGNFTGDAIIDSPDGQVIPPGTGKVSLTWMARGTQENNFQSTTIDGTENFGGFRFAIDPAAQAAPKITIVTKWIVDFRGRV